MTGTDPKPQELGEKFLKSLDETQLGAAASKLFAANIGEVVLVFSRSPAHKHRSLADIEWMVLPPIAAAQFYVVEIAEKARGFHAPVAVVTWALVSEDVDRSLQQAGSLPRLRPDQWRCGEIGWLIDAVGDRKALNAALQWLKAGPFRERPLKLIARDRQGSAIASTLDALLMERTESVVA